MGKRSLRKRLRIELYLELEPLRSRLRKNETDRLGSISNRLMSLEERIYTMRRQGHSGIEKKKQKTRRGPSKEVAICKLRKETK